jgi:hypothetical protein
MRHIDDLNFELNACLDRAKKIKDDALVNGLLFSLLTLDELEKTIKSEDKIVTPQVTALDGVTPLGITPWAFPVGRSDND